MRTNADAGVDHDAIAAFRERIRAAVEQAERDGVPAGQQASIFAHLAYGQFQRTDHPTEAFMPWMQSQREHADETQILEGFLYAMEEAEEESDAESGNDGLLVSSSTDIPRSSGWIPWSSYDARPPETILDAYWKCPHCRETMPTLYELWRLYRNRRRCIDRKNEYEYGSREWNAYNEGVKHYRKRIEQVTVGLDDSTRKWAREVIQSEFSETETDSE